MVLLALFDQQFHCMVLARRSTSLFKKVDIIRVTYIACKDSS